MKRLPILILLLFSSVLLLSSCGKQSSFALTKRHYRSGYYVDFGTKSHVNSIIKATALTTKKAAKQTPSKINSRPAELLTANTPSVTPVKFAKVKSAESKKRIIPVKTVDHIAAPEKQSANILNASVASNGSDNASPIVTATQDEVRVYVVNVPFVIILLCAIFIPPLGVGLMYGLNIYFWVDLLLTLLFFIPGLIFALVVVLM